MSRWYKLDDEHNVIPCETLFEWAEFFEGKKKIVKQENIGKIRVSTVFLGLDYSFEPGQILLFETMIFGGPLDQHTERYSTREEAEAGHAEMVELVS